MFRKKIVKPEPVPQEIGNIPSGTAIEANGIYFFVKDNKKHLITSKRVLQSQSYPRVVKVTPKSANAIPNALGKIGFREGTVIKGIGRPEYFLISNNKRRSIVDPDVFQQLQIDINDVIIVSGTELKLHEVGEDIGRL